MTFGNFIKTINASNVYGFPRNDFAVFLLQAAGIKVSEDSLCTTVVKWIDRKVPDHINSYFENAKVRENDIINFLSSHIRQKWEDLQAEFIETDCSRINCYTKDRDEFFQSLLEEFVMSLGLPAPEESSTKQMFRIYLQAFRKYHIENFIECDPTCQLNVDLAESAENFTEFIKRDILEPFYKNKDDELYKRIDEFAVMLGDYINYLILNMIPSCYKDESKDEKRLRFYIPRFREENIKWEMEFGEKILADRKEIAHKHMEILSSNEYQYSLFVPQK